MSTPKWLKEKRIEAQRKASNEKKHKELFAINPRKNKGEFKVYEPKAAYSYIASKLQRFPSFTAEANAEQLSSSCSKVERKQYSGDYIIGIATMHKSNLVPIGRGDNPEHYATMRRN